MSPNVGQSTLEEQTNKLRIVCQQQTPVTQISYPVGTN